jgi:hypothetical protein
MINKLSAAIRRLDFNNPPTAVGGIGESLSLLVCWASTIPQLPLGEFLNSKFYAPKDFKWEFASNIPGYCTP